MTKLYFTTFIFGFVAQDFGPSHDGKLHSVTLDLPPDYWQSNGAYVFKHDRGELQ